MRNNDILQNTIIERNVELSARLCTMEHNHFINSIRGWLDGDRSFSDAQVLFDKSNEYISLIPNKPFDVSTCITSRTYSKGTKLLFGYGYYTKSVFETKCIENTRKGKLVDYKPWYKPGSFYNFEYGFDKNSRLIATKQYEEIPNGVQKMNSLKEFGVLYDTVIEHPGNDEIALIWNVYSKKNPSFLALATAIVNKESKQATVTLHCIGETKYLPSYVYNIDLSIYDYETKRLDYYSISKIMDTDSSAFINLSEKEYRNGIYQRHDVFSLNEN